MRALITYGIFNEIEEEVYEHTALSLKLTTPPMSLSALPLAARTLTGIARLPEYLAKTSYRNPGDDPSSTQSLFQFTNNTQLEFFEWMQTQPGPLAAFNASMAHSIAMERARTGKGFADLYPFETLAKSHTSDEVVLVDIGGGVGQVLEDIRKHVPRLVGKMILEDLPKTVSAHVPLENVEFVDYNFLTTEQPIKGARAYLLRHVLHDWSDNMVRKILLNTIPALGEDSKILIVEVVLPPMNAPVFSALMDIQMMIYGGAGRKERQWRALFESVGMEIEKIWPAAKGDSVMELALRSS